MFNKMFTAMLQQYTIVVKCLLLIDDNSEVKLLQPTT